MFTADSSTAPPRVSRIERMTDDIAEKSRVPYPVRSGKLIGAEKVMPARLTGTALDGGGPVCWDVRRVRSQTRIYAHAGGRRREAFSSAHFWRSAKGSVFTALRYAFVQICPQVRVLCKHHFFRRQKVFILKEILLACPWLSCHIHHS